MFKKSRKKIVAAILSVLILLLFGTFCIIYLASYVEMTNENKALLEEYVNAYTIPEKPDMGVSGGRTEGERGNPPGKPPMLELSTFYSVAVSKSGEVLRLILRMYPR